MTSPSKHVTVLAQDDEDAARLARGLRAWWRRLSGPLRAIIAAVPIVLAVAAAVLGVLDVRADVSRTEAVTVGHEVRLQAVERSQAARAAVQASERAAVRIEAAESRIDRLEAVMPLIQSDLRDIRRFMLYGTRPDSPGKENEQ